MNKQMNISTWIEKFNAGIKKLFGKKSFKDNFPLLIALFDNQFNDNHDNYTDF